MTGGVVRRDGLREKVASRLVSIHFNGYGCGTNGTGGCSHCYGPSPMSAHEIADEVMRLLDAVPDVPPTEDGRASLADHIKAGMLRGRVRLPDEPDEVCPKCGRHPGDADVAVVLPVVPPDPTAVDRDELARWLYAFGSLNEPEVQKARYNAGIAALNDRSREIWLSKVDALLSSGVLVAAADVRARAAEKAWDECAEYLPLPRNQRDALHTANPYRAVSEREGGGS